MNLKLILLILIFLKSTSVFAQEQNGDDWKLVEIKDVGSYWQKTSSKITGPAGVIDKECPPGMIFIQGLMKRDSPKLGSVEMLQDQTCTNWIDRKFPARCAIFDSERWKNLSQDLPKKEMKFCIDQFEYPNLKGANPAININWYEAQNICKSEGKRLCNEDEWTFACEGEEAMPYPYGYERSKKICNIDREWRDFSKIKLLPKKDARAGLSKLWQGRESGSLNECKSVFGVYDLAGNVDEWTSSTSKTGYKSIMKGGYWSLVRNRCRPATRAHNEGHTFYQQGFRCCK